MMFNVPGLSYKDYFIDENKEKELFDFIKKQKWNKSIKRLTQHYGALYEYRYGKVDTEYVVQPPPPIFMDLFDKVRAEGMGGETSRLQIIVNKYTASDRLSPHVDDTELFGSWIVGISLNADTVMYFQKSDVNYPIELKRRSVYEMKDDARYKYTHAIPCQKDGIRISITFRPLIGPKSS